MTGSKETLIKRNPGPFNADRGSVGVCVDVE